MPRPLSNKGHLFNLSLTSLYKLFKVNHNKYSVIYPHPFNELAGTATSKLSLSILLRG